MYILISYYNFILYNNYLTISTEIKYTFHLEQVYSVVSFLSYFSLHSLLQKKRVNKLLCPFQGRHHYFQPLQRSCLAC